jgi:hypothetical protein
MKAFPRDSDGRFMDLRDYFAAQAMTALALNQGSLGTEEYSFEDAALDCYLMADELMKARTK